MATPTKFYQAVLTTAVLIPSAQLTYSQTERTATLRIELNNAVFYQNDITDPQKYASDPNKTTVTPARVFNSLTATADIVSVNGSPARGVWVARGTVLLLSPSPQPGQSISDVGRIAFERHVWVMLDGEGRELGSLTADGLRGGPPGPLSDRSCASATWAITGGTGVFRGSRGEGCGIAAPTERFASAGEDPSNRRLHGEGTGFRQLLHVSAAVRPEIGRDSAGPAVVHASDFTRVTAQRPARRGEVLTLYATGLGPTQPDANGAPFPSNVPAPSAIPVQVSVNDTVAELLFAGF